ncbi:MAG TPA: hypothetical protein PK786_11435 [Treponemataceae bacterium]|nr:hypothetical protein [Treponemataceae bacterium]
MKGKLVIFAVMLVVAAATLPVFAFGSRDKEPAANPDWTQVKEGDRVIVSGKIRLVGSAVSNSLVLTDSSDKDWYVDEAERDVLALMEQRETTLSAVVRLDPIKFADGTELPDKRVLTGIELVK